MILPSLIGLDFLPLHHAGTLLTLAIILVVGIGFGWAFKRIGLPSVTGQIVAGILLGADVLHVFEEEAIHGLAPVTDFALGLIGVAVGSHLHFKKLRNAWKRLTLLLLFEVTLVPFLVWVGVLILGGVVGEEVAGGGLWVIGPLLAACAISTAPATIVALVKETHSKGVFVKTLVAAIALNNMACIAFFELGHTIVKAQLDQGQSFTLMEGILAPIRQLGFSAILGGIAGVALIRMARNVATSDKLATYSMVAILLTVGFGKWLGISPLLACLFLGTTLANLSPDNEEIGHAVFANFEIAIYAAFFTLAGMHLDFDLVGPAILLASLVVALRAVGKYSSGWLAMKLAGATDKVRQYLGLALIPQAGVAVGLIIVILEDPLFSASESNKQIQGLFVAVGLTSVLLNEIIGPITTRFALLKSGDAGKDRARLIDFLHEENITTNLQAETKEEAIEKLVDLLIATNHLEIDRDAFLQSVLEREREFSTCLGSGLAIPHGVLEQGDRILGVMGISQEGLPFETPDGIPVHCFILLATPKSERDRHLEVLAAFARAIGRDPHVQHQLYHAKSPAHAYEILHAEEAVDFNYFLDAND
ncbi:MAG TPA: PTS fructose transporter subunit IIA [Planctomycetes bacterium]|nr:PTS fructose transporter subunit IIA [Planctomycetota bacterium]